MQQEWAALHEAGLPSEQRPAGSSSHRPHLTLFAGASVAPEVDVQLSDLVAGLDLSARLGALSLFGPQRERYVLVHQVVPSAALLELQAAVAAACGADHSGYFGPGRWTPHVTVARRVRPEDLPRMLRVLGAGGVVDHAVRITRCRRWDSVERRTWLL